LREVGAPDHVAALADRLPAAGMFGLFLQQKAPRISIHGAVAQLGAREK
jgi:hypothetical protein